MFVQCFAPVKNTLLLFSDGAGGAGARGRARRGDAPRGSVLVCWSQAGSADDAHLSQN